MPTPSNQYKGSNNMQKDLLQFAKRTLVEQGHNEKDLDDAYVKSVLNMVPQQDQIKLLAMRSAFR